MAPEWASDPRICAVIQVVIATLRRACPMVSPSRGFVEGGMAPKSRPLLMPSAYVLGVTAPRRPVRVTPCAVSAILDPPRYLTPRDFDGLGGLSVPVAETPHAASLRVSPRGYRTGPRRNCHTWRVPCDVSTTGQTSQLSSPRRGMAAERGTKQDAAVRNAGEPIRLTNGAGVRLYASLATLPRTSPRSRRNGSA